LVSRPSRGGGRPPKGVEAAIEIGMTAIAQHRDCQAQIRDAVRALVAARRKMLGTERDMHAAEREVFAAETRLKGAYADREREIASLRARNERTCRPGAAA
jgi:hypothetical protein